MKMKKTVIRVFEKVEASPLDILNNFRNVLNGIGCWKEEMGEKFVDPKWIVSDSGIQWEWDYLGYHDYLPSKFSGLSIQATAQPYPLNTRAGLFQGGIICTMCLKFENQASKFDLSAYAIINEIALLLFNAFKTRPVILLMDESKQRFPPGNTWEPIELSIYKSMLNPWNFDYAILPKSLEQVYEPRAATHVLKKHEKYTESWRIDKWKKDVLTGLSGT